MRFISMSGFLLYDQIPTSSEIFVRYTLSYYQEYIIIISKLHLFPCRPTFLM